MAPTFLFIVLAALVHFSSAASNNFPSFRQVRRINIRKQNGRQTPAPFNCVKAGFFGDPKDCNRFYRCVDYYGNEAQFTLFEFVCAEGTIFDESLSVCNHPHAVNPPPACLATTSLVTPTAPTTAPTDAPTAAPTAPTVPTTEFAPDVLPVDPVTTTTAAPVPEPITAAPAPVTTTVAAPATTTVSSGESELTPAITPIVPPPTDAAPFMLTCNDDKFHRHPVRCDLYYKCVWTELAFSVDLRACPPGQHYDEASGTCKSPGRTTACVFATLPPTGVVTTVPTVTTTVATEAPPAVPTTAVATEAPAVVPTTTVATEAPVTAAATTTALPAVETTATTAPSVPAQYTLAPGSLYDCKMPGHYPYQLDCIRFYRCFEIEARVLKGLLYRCPIDYAYSTVTERCVRQNTLPACDRNGIRLPMDFPVPLIPLEDTTMVLLEDFDSFFGNPNYFYIPRRKIKTNPQSSRIRNKPQPQPKNKRY
ncbi:hypothetical protein DAPPUDRAFT_322382 [Daphnia pulex]|uniref:Chitin-binding type-2 domain-containing protein n=1 Tax=Daphnia pulex TaxID=6669 RepID=E9GVR9_DAPPU|nr:hypothetical protein DAPPUDRAFT_322382 [Daphnia pulex]|eukprot:EFX76479.1 hypothetical protein DAPPUDRAFT_322382 [Daphnia pulex]